MHKKQLTFRYDKLVRDNVVPDLLKDNIQVVYRKPQAAELLFLLKAKLQEEAKEVLEAVTLEELKEELADVLDVVEGLVRACDISDVELLALRKKKREARGAFLNPVFVETITISEDHRVARYCLERPDRYPQDNSSE